MNDPPGRGSEGEDPGLQHVLEVHERILPDDYKVHDEDGPQRMD